MEKTKGGLDFSKASLKATVSNLRENCYFNVGNVKMKKAIEIPMGIDPTPFCSNLCLYSYEEYMSSLFSSDKIKARHFDSTKRFIDGLCIRNGVGEFVKYIQSSSTISSALE